MLVQSNYQMLVGRGQEAPSLKGDVTRIKSEVATQIGGKAKHIRLASSQGTVSGVSHGRTVDVLLSETRQVRVLAPYRALVRESHLAKRPDTPGGIHLVEFGEFWPMGPGVLIP